MDQQIAMTEFVTENQRLLEPDVRRGLIHSHHNMKAYFSKGTKDSRTDWGELLSNFHLHDFYLSVVVNNADDLVAKVVSGFKYILPPDVSRPAVAYLPKYNIEIPVTETHLGFGYVSGLAVYDVAVERDRGFSKTMQRFSRIVIGTPRSQIMQRPVRFEEAYKQPNLFNQEL